MMRVARIIFISRVNRIALTATPAPELLSDSTKRAFLSFPYVCPESVLVKSSFLYTNGKKPVFLPQERIPIATKQPSKPRKQART